MRDDVTQDTNCPSANGPKARPLVPDRVLRLADETDVEILNWLDDHSSYLLSCAADQFVNGDDVVATFLDLVEEYGAPQSTLTDG